MEIVLYIIILGLVLNLAANMIWKYLPKTEKHIDVWATAVLILICILLVVFNKEKEKSETIDVKPSPTEQLPTYEAKANPKILVDIVRQQQLNNVKKSYGELAYQCFTDDDLRQFVEQGKSVEIAGQLKQNNEFLEVVLAIKKLRVGRRNQTGKIFVADGATGATPRGAEKAKI
jgi:hypothetical protein